MMPVSSEEFVLLGKEAVEGVRFNGFYNGIQENGSEEFTKRLQDRYHKEPDSYAILAF